LKHAKIKIKNGGFMYQKVLLFLVGDIFLFSGCAYTVVRPVKYSDRDMRGYRIYDPQPILVSTCETTSIAFVPNFNRGYSVISKAWLAKNKSTIKETSGILSEATTDVDSTAILTFIQTLGAEAIKQAEKLAALGEGATGGMKKAGLWRLDYDENGILTGLHPIGELYDCPNKQENKNQKNEEPSNTDGRGLPRP
jgi:hypothetical protein